MDFLQSFDRAVALFFGGIDCGPIDFLMVFFSTVAELGAVYIIIAAYLFFFRKDRNQAIAVLVSLLFSVVLCHILKDIFDRTRPYIELGIEILVSPPLGSSFPSAHSSTAFSFATVMFLFYRKSAPWFAVCSVLLASAVAFSRIWLCVHYLSDVVVGAMFGVAVGITIFLIFQTVKKIRSK